MPGVDDYYGTLNELNIPTTVSGRVTAELELAEPGFFEPKNKKVFGKEGFSKKSDAKGYDAVVREVYEESGLKVEVDRLVLVQENFFEMEDGMHHEIAFYYLMKDIGSQKISGTRVLDFEEEGLEWLNIDTLSDNRVYPEIYNKILKDIPNDIIHSVVDERKH